MTIETSEKLYTIPEYGALDLEDMDDYELIAGRLVKQGSVDVRHSGMAEQARIVESFITL